MSDVSESSAKLAEYVLRLENRRFREIARKASGSDVASVEVVLTPRAWPEYGVCGDKCVLGLSYQTEAGRNAEISVFVKRQDGHSGFKETPHYEFLNSMGFPVPRLYGSLLDEEEMEILFLEDIEPNTEGIRLLDKPDGMEEFLALAARFNALSPCGEYGGSLYHFSSARSIERSVKAIDSIWAAGAEHQLGDELLELCSQDRKRALLEQLRHLGESVASLALGYAHNEYVPQQIGRRAETGEMLVFDLRTTGLGPRFVDVAPWLGDPECESKTGRTAAELAERYLEGYLSAGGPSTTLGALQSECRVLWQTSKVSGAVWGVARALLNIDPTTQGQSASVAIEGELLTDLAGVLRTL